MELTLQGSIKLIAAYFFDLGFSGLRTRKWGYFAMEDKILKEIQNQLEINNLLLGLLLRQMKVKGSEIASAMGISEGRLSQLLNPQKYGRKKK